ncbi:unnamed protein product [Caenorhabditis brenneri]
MPATPTFPLLGLPDEEILRTIRTMDLEQILKFSLVSDKCKNLVTSIKIKGTACAVHIFDSILFHIKASPSLLELGFYREPDMYWGMGEHGRKKKLIAPQSVKVNEYGPIGSGYSRSTLEKNELTMHYWLKHLQDIFNYHEIDFIGFAFNSSQFDINDIKEVFGTATKLMIGNTGCHVFNQMILERFSPIEQLNIKTSNFPNSKVPERILTQSFEDLEIGDGWLETTILPLDQQVLINSKAISMDSLRMPAKELNKFIKLWQKGSNPRMEYLAVVYATVNQGDKEVMMKGIQHEIMPANRLRKFKATGNRMPEEIEGGIDIVRVDGVKATIRFKNRYPSPAVEMLISFTAIQIFVMIFLIIISWFSEIFGTLFPNDSAGSIIAQAPTHPLLSLPEDEIVRKLREMSLTEILKFSLISERCKNLVKSIQIEATSFRVGISSNINVYIEIGTTGMALAFYEESELYWGTGAYGRKKKLTAPQSISVYEYGRAIVAGNPFPTLEKNDLTMQYWLKNLQDIFNYPKIDYIRFVTNSFQFDIDDIKEVFGNTLKIIIGITGCHVFNRMILDKFSPIEQLKIKTSDFPNSIIPERILMQNFDALEIGDLWMETTIMSLDQLLLINSKQIHIDALRMSAKQLNKFIRLWQSGSNPRMEYLTVAYTDTNEFDNEVLTRRIKQEIIPADRMRQFKIARNGSQKLVSGGIDIVRVDGVKATIQFKNGHPMPSLEMFVWFDHCVVGS